VTNASLFSPPDVDAAHDAWTANCGPCSLAALLRRPVAELREAFCWYPARPWCSPTQMLGAMAALKVSGSSQQGATGSQLLTDGLAYIQWTGPWTAPTASARWAYRHTHWIAVGLNGDAVYDANMGAWIQAEKWRDVVAPELLRDVRRAYGGWFLRTVIRVRGTGVSR
jgi:hypothetical protein